MLVEMGQQTARKVAEDRSDPTVVYVTVGDATYTVADSGVRMTIGRGNDGEVSSAADLAAKAREHIADAIMFNNGVFHMPGQEALLDLFHVQQSEGDGKPLWVWSDNEEFAVLLGEFFGCPVGRPDDVEGTHHTDAGPPGVGVDREARAEAAAQVAVANQPSEE